MLRSLQAAGSYFLLVFGAGFLLGIMRVLWLVPRIGERVAELMEMPIMLVVSVIAARWVIRRLDVPPTPARRLPMGGLALGFLILAELALVLGMRGLTIAEYFATRDPVSGAAFVIMLLVFALMPMIVVRHPPSRASVRGQQLQGLTR